MHFIFYLANDVKLLSHLQELFIYRISLKTAYVEIREVFLHNGISWHWAQITGVEIEESNTSRLFVFLLDPLSVNPKK